MMPSTYAPPRTGLADDLWVFMPSTCRQCPASGCGPVFDTTEDPHTVAWPGGNRPVTCTYECRVCGCTWTDTWPLWGLLGSEIS